MMMEGSKIESSASEEYKGGEWLRQEIKERDQMRERLEEAKGDTD